MPILALGFLNPLLLWALPIAAVPIVIHLLNRRRFDRRPWAAMEFLLRAMKKSRRRLRMEQWLILLLRTLAVLLLVLLVSRPTQQSDSLLGTTRVHHVVVVDDSASMGARSGAESAFDRALDATRGYVRSLGASAAGDRFTLIRTSDATSPAIAAVPIAAGAGDLENRVRDALESWTVGDLRFDPANDLRSILDGAAEGDTAADPIDLRVLTDLRRCDWLDDAGALGSAQAAMLETLEARKAQLTVIDVGHPDDANLAVVAVRSIDRLHLVDVPVRLEVEVVNRGTGSSEPTDLSIEIDGASRDSRPLPALRPGASTVVELEARFETAGSHGVRATLATDRFATDDQRSLAIDVREASRVLVVDGDPGSGGYDAESFFLQFALDPSSAAFQSGIDLRLVDDRQFTALLGAARSETDNAEETAGPLDDVDLLVLCNIARLSDKGVATVADWTTRGGGLLVFLGDRVEPQRYVSNFWREATGGLLAARIGRVRGDLDEPQPIHLADEQHPALRRNTEELRFFLDRLGRIGRYFEIDVPVEGSQRVLLRVGGAGGPPLLVERPIGDAGGSLLLFGSTADASWSELPRSPAFPILLQELHAHAARRHDDSDRNLGPTGVFAVPIDPAVHQPEVRVAALDGGDQWTFAADVAASPQDDETARDEPGAKDGIRVDLARLTGYGIFAVRRSLHAGGTDEQLLARNPLLDEGRLAPLQLAEFRSALPETAQERVQIKSAADRGAATELEAGRDSNLWRWFGGLMLLMLLAETLLLPRFGRR